MVFVRYGTTRPDEIRLSDDRSSLYVDPTDERVYRLLVLKSWRAHYSRLQEFWRAANRRYSPTSVVDVGVNAGECLFCTRYPSDAFIVGFEANPWLQSVLERNRARHPDGERIEILSEIATDTDAQTKSFYVDRAWSGKSSVVVGVATQASAVEEVTVRTTTVDAALAGREHTLERLLFKIDVEGHEQAVLRGMTRSLERSRSAVGFMEFDESYLQRAGVDPARFLCELKQRFHVMAFVDGEQLVDLESLELEDLRTMVRDDPCHTDLVLLAGEEAERFGAWASTWPACLSARP
jgi:FkbM family methyltransferase